MGLQLILTHENSDFDGLASQLAAWKLHPAALPVLARHTNRNLRDFLVLYGQELPFTRYDELPRRMVVDRIVLVDTQTLVTPRGMADETEVQIIDHHPLGRDLPPHWTYSGGGTGATTTLLLEPMIETGHALTPVEATLLALGIYEDTGSLVYPGTSVRDLRCATWLMEHGANLEVVSRFLHYPLKGDQLALYNALLGSAETLNLSGHTVMVATAIARGPVEEISSLAHKIRDLYDPAGLFVLVDQGESLQLVARSTTDAIDVGHIAQHLGGGGHSRAAAALIRNQGLEATRRMLMELLTLHVHPTVTVAQLMSYGVHTLPASATVDEAAEAMLKYGFEGFPIVGGDGEIVGILTRREIDRASRLNLGTMPASQTMTKGDIQVSPDDSLERLRQVMTDFAVGQVPVVRDHEIIGVVTRTDLIKAWAAPSRQQPRPEEIAGKIEAALPGSLLVLLRQASELAQELGYPLYVVGGFVRDLLLGEPTLDMDLVVEGDAVLLARRLARRVGASTRSHQRFGTAKIILEGREAEFGLSSLDFATARLEFYAHSAALPEVESSSIKADLHRRDFTINTLAIRLDFGHYGELLDFYGGMQDLTDHLVRVLHSLSFIEDPTRIMRAARFEQRLGFSIEARTAELIDNALPMLSRVSGERIRHELYLILAEPEPERVIRRLDSLHVLGQIHPRLTCPEATVERFIGLRQAVASGQWDIAVEGGRPAPALYVALLVRPLERADAEAVAERVRVFRSDLALLHQVLDLREKEADLDRPELPDRQLYALLHNTDLPALLVQWLSTGSEQVRERLWRYAQVLRHVQPMVDGEYLKSLGLRPSPVFRKLLQAVRDARLEGTVRTREEEEALIARLLAEQEGREHHE